MASDPAGPTMDGAPSKKTRTRTYPLMSRRQIEALIAEGRSIFIVDQYVLKVDAWIKYHPGGGKSIAHMVGRDATDEVTVLHSPEAQEMMKKYRVGRIEGRWTNFIPPIQGGKFRSSEMRHDGADADQESPHIQELAMNTLSSTGSSRSPSPPASPIFDVLEHNNSYLRSRPGHGAGGDKSPGSVTSNTTTSSSVEDDHLPFDGMTYLDSETRKEISLDLSKYPSLDAETQDSIVRKYRVLHQTIKAAGLFNCNYAAYAIECARYTLLFASFLLFLSWNWYALSALFLGCFWHQLVFTAHDAGHMGITHDFHTDTVIGILIADFLGGLSLGWWKLNHNVHHIVTNFPEHDPDIEHLPFFAVSHRLLAGLRSTYYDRVMAYDAPARFFVRLQDRLYYVVMLFARFNLYRLSWDFLLFGRGPRGGIAWWHRWLEVAGQVFFWTWFGYGVLYRCIPTWQARLLFLLVSHAVTAPLHVQITLSHFAMSTADLGPHESFPQKMLRTTMDVDCPQWLDFFHGGLQFQAIHHLYPRIPRHNLRATQRLVQGFCEEVGIPYALYGFVDGNREVIGRLAEVSRQAAILAKCRRVMAAEAGEVHGHGH